MPLNYLGALVLQGPENVAGWHTIKTYGPIVLLLAGTKYFFGGAKNTWERDLHGKVYIITGATSGMGARIAYELASKGAQVILLVRSTHDAWLIGFVEDLRTTTNNFMIYAEECDLDSLYSVRKFATKWLDSKLPRRLDGVICCAAECMPVGKDRMVTEDGVEKHIGVNYLGHFHLLTLIAPSLRSQPPDRDVRVIIPTCLSQATADVDLNDILWTNRRYPRNQPFKVFGTSKLMLGMFAGEFQRRISNYERKDKVPCNVRLHMVNPGLMRTPSTRRFLSFGSIMGLLLYLLLYPLILLLLKTPFEGAQSIFFALAVPLSTAPAGSYIQECKVIKPSRKELSDEALQGKLFTETEKAIESLEKNSAIQRKKKEQDDAKKNKSTQKDSKKGKNNKQDDEKTNPNDVNELNSKLESIRSLLGMQQTLNNDELPLFPN